MNDRKIGQCLRLVFKVTKFGEQSQFGRPCQPVEIALVYLLLTSQEGCYISGEVYGATGGAGIA